MLHPWYGTSTLVWIEALGALAGLLVIALGVWLCSPVDLDVDGPLDDYGTKLVEWEKDRVSGVAKGVASTSIGFLTALIAALVKDNIAFGVPRLAILGCLLGSVGGLLVALHLTLSTRAYAAQRGSNRGTS